MIRTLWFMIRTALLLVAGWWLWMRPGEITLSWENYKLTADTGLLALAGFIALLFLLWTYRGLLFLVRLPRHLREKNQNRHMAKGYRALTRGLGAVAIGDGPRARRHAKEARQHLPEDQGLINLLEAQAARLCGEDAVARAEYVRLLGHKDTAMFGVRGLLQAALATGDYTQALEHVRKARKLNPKQATILQLCYDLELRTRDWKAADQTRRQLEKIKALSAVKSNSDRVAIALAQGEEAKQAGDKTGALRLLKAAYKYDPHFAPAVFGLARFYLHKGTRAQAVKLIEKTWKRAPHPDLLPLWDALVPGGKGSLISRRFKWYERLIALNPKTAYAHVALGQIALEEGLWGEARFHFLAAENIAPDQDLYKLLAELERKEGRGEDAEAVWLEKALEAPVPRDWVCTESGRLYKSWSPIAAPHGSFNTITWDVPQPGAQSTTNFAMGFAQPTLLD